MKKTLSSHQHPLDGDPDDPQSCVGLPRGGGAHQLLQKDSAISTNTAFQLPPAEGFAGLGNYANAIHSKGFLAALLQQLYYLRHLCGADPGLLLHVRVVYHPREDVGHEALLLPVRVLHGGALPDAHVHPGKSGG